MAESTLVVFLILILTGYSSSRDLRPSEHGLLFQTLSPAGTHSSPEMRSFFNSDNSSPTVSSSSSSDVAMPNAITTGDHSTPPSSWRRVSGEDGDQVGNALKAASLACGIVGAFLILASSLIYVFKYRKRVQGEAMRGNNGEFENDDGNNKMQLVLRDPSS
ncbi:unnamed protein product [Lathyrus oleraceus]|uniref:Transmembrane protein n=1 Tax=Pisum sativum TaxID=3888 RepID=A0A9D4ZTF9_PEA|nr:uncharacterized protein LOC127106621 [Pisum sativum]KAI5384787.1 hypothetical protein KIW84_071691 [Pisum sativum]